MAALALLTFPWALAITPQKKEMWHLDSVVSRLEYETHALSPCGKGAGNRQTFTAFLSLPFLLGISFHHIFACIYSRCICIAQSQGCSDKQNDQKRTAVLAQFSALGRLNTCCFSQYCCSISVPKSQFPEEKGLCVNMWHSYFHLTSYFSVTHQPMHGARHCIDWSPNSLLLSWWKRTKFKSQLHPSHILWTMRKN